MISTSNLRAEDGRSLHFQAREKHPSLIWQYSTPSDMRSDGRKRLRQRQHLGDAQRRLAVEAPHCKHARAAALRLFCFHCSNCNPAPALVGGGQHGPARGTRRSVRLDRVCGHCRAAAPRASHDDHAPAHCSRPCPSAPPLQALVNVTEATRCVCKGNYVKIFNSMPSISRGAAAAEGVRCAGAAGERSALTRSAHKTSSSRRCRFDRPSQRLSRLQRQHSSLRAPQTCWPRTPTSRCHANKSQKMV